MPSINTLNLTIRTMLWASLTTCLHLALLCPMGRLQLLSSIKTSECLNKPLWILALNNALSLREITIRTLNFAKQSAMMLLLCTLAMVSAKSSSLHSRTD